MPKNVMPLIATVGVVAGGGFAAYRWLFKKSDHVSLWTVEQALNFHKTNGFHHPKLPSHVRTAVLRMDAAERESVIRL